MYIAVASATIKARLTFAVLNGAALTVLLAYGVLVASGATEDDGDEEEGVEPAVTVTKTVVGAVGTAHWPA